MSLTRSSRLRATALALTLVLAAGGTAGAAYAADPSPSPAPATTTEGPSPDASPSADPTDAPSDDTAGSDAPADQTPPTVERFAVTAPASTPVPAPQCARTPSGASTAHDGPYFNYPYSGSAAKNRIRYMVLRAIRSTPGCDRAASGTGYVGSVPGHTGYYWNLIRVAAFSVNDNVTVDALIAAAQRGVVVQVIANSHNLYGPAATRSPSLKRLIGKLRQINQSQKVSLARTADTFAKVCRHSCRGTGGNHHYKMYLFSHTGTKHWVAMAGSANLTIKASAGQWNHLDVYTDYLTYKTYNGIFRELTADRPARGQFRNYLTDRVRTWFFPRPGTRASNDPLMVGSSSLSGISCTHSGYGNGRTIVRIGMYAWYESRGLWLAQKVRRLWNAGCNVAVEYAVMGNTVKRVLYSPAGRGRIPMRQVATYYRDGTVANYDHQKYVTVLGRYNGRSRTTVTWAGTTNWSNLGLYSDDLTQIWRDGNRAASYRAAFYRVWRGPHTRVPSPTSALPGKVGKGNITFGKGKYRNLENN